MGIGKEVIDLIMRYSFYELGLNRLDSDVISTNEQSLYVYTQKCGWEVVGRQSEWYFRDNEWRDRVLIGITRKQYLKNQTG
jgi:RimJ/RimL family protein N-acetyltransferase